jgi:hypothetical protein
MHKSNSGSTMLRITVQDTPEQVTLKLEGSLIGSWVMELEDSWRTSGSTAGSRPLSVDLTSVDNVDNAGRYLLALLHDRGVELVASGLVMTDLVASIDEEWRRRKKV